MNSNITENIPEKKTYTKLLTHIRNLPSIPVVIFEVSKLLADPMTSATDLGRVIGRDQGLVAKILTVANSPFYGLPRKVSTIEFAIVILGFDHIKNIVMALSMIEAFKKNSGSNWDSESYWNHTLMTAGASKRIADELGYPKPGEVFTAGLLHDLGIAVIQRYLNDEFNAIYEAVSEQQISYLKAEEQVLGLTHQEVGLFLADRWNLPEALSDPIAHHHLPSKSEKNNYLASIVHLADYMTQKLGVGNFQWDEGIEIDENIIDILGFNTRAKLDEYIERQSELFKKQQETVTI